MGGMQHDPWVTSLNYIKAKEPCNLSHIQIQLNIIELYYIVIYKVHITL